MTEKQKWSEVPLKKTYRIYISKNKNAQIPYIIRISAFFVF